MCYHHRPSNAPQYADTAAVVQLADILARGLEYGNAGDATVPPIDAAAFRNLGLSFETIGHVIEKADDDYRGGMNLFGL